MYSWNTIRTVCGVLLLLPLVHLALLLARETLATLDKSPTVWAPEMEAYVRQDERSSLPRDPIVIIGGRRVALWPDLKAVTAPKPVLVRDLGNATVDDLSHYHERLVSFYRPSVVVLLPGNTEFRLRDNKSGPELARAIRQLAQHSVGLDPQCRFYVISPIKTLLFPEDHAKIDEAGRLLAAWADANTHIRLLDANPMLANLTGEPDPRHFRNDGVQLNESGYLRLGFLLHQALQEDYPQDYQSS